MAVDLYALKTMEGVDDNRIERKLPTITTQGGNVKEATTKSNANTVEAGVVVYKKGAWSKEEDEKLRKAVEEYGVRNWVTIEKFSGLVRPAKNCRLRWLNYLRPNLKKYPFTQEEEKLILHLHSKYGNSWSRIASKLPGRSDNEIKNFWHKRAKKCKKQHLPTYPTTREERKQSHTKDEPNANDKYFPSYPNHILPSTSVQLANTPRDASSMIHSPQTLISTSQKLELTHKTTPSTNTPTSQNFQLSPYQKSQPSSNAFVIPLIEPPILSSPQGRFKRFSTPQNQLAASISGLPHSTTNALAFQPQHSSLQMQRSPIVESPISPLKLNLSPGVSQQTVGSPRAPFSPLSPLNLHLSSIPVPSESNLSIPDSSNILLNSLTPAIQLASPIEPLTVDTDKVIQYSTLKTKPPLVQFGTLETGKTISSLHEVESNHNLEIMEELREAQAKVRFLKKQLRQKRILEETNVHKISSRKEDFQSENLKTTNLYGRELAKQVPLNENSSHMTTKESLSSTSSRTKDSEKILRIGGDIIIENRLSKLPETENFESIGCMQESIMSKKVTTLGEVYIENPESLQRGEDSHSIDEIFKMKNAMNLHEDSSFKGDLFGQRPRIEQSLADQFGTVYHQGTTTTLVESDDKSGRLGYLQPDEGGYFGDNFKQENISLMDGNLATSMSFEGNLLLHHCATIGLKEPSYLVSELMMEYESSRNSIQSSKLCESSLLLPQCSTANLLDSNYLVSKQIMGQESLHGKEFSFQTSNGENSIETSELCESIFLLNHYPATNMMDTKCLVSFNNKRPIGEQYTLQATACGHYHGDLKTNCMSRETSGHEHSPVESLMEGLLVENLWPEEQMVSQDQAFLPNRSDPAINLSRLTHLTKSKNWNNESNYGDAEIRNQEHGHIDTSIQSLEWYNNGNTNCEKFDKGLGLHVTSTSQPLLTIADCI